MINLKKKIAVVAAAGVLMSLSISSVNASLWSYKKGDVDDDGSVTQSDKATMQQVLHGYSYPDATTIERLDLNRDYVIDAYDRTLLSNILSGSMSTSTVFYEFTDPFPEQSSRGYYICSPSTGYPTRYYTLPQITSLSDSLNSPRVIIGDDDRYIENGLDGVIDVQRSDGSNLGTAFVIDSHTLLTAAHVVYGGANLKFKIFTNYNTQSNIQITPTAYHVPYAYANNTGGCGWKYDYAIVRVQEDLSDYNDHSYINFDLGLMRDEMSHSKPVYVTGFGGPGNGVTPELIHVKSTGVGYLLDTPDVSKDYAINFSTDIVRGDSGAPVYVKNSDGSNSVIAICTVEGSNFNSGCRITSNILQFVYNNTNLNTSP